jgi:Site-specific recombinase XerD
LFPPLNANCCIFISTSLDYTKVKAHRYQKKQLNGARKDGKFGGLSAKTIRNQHMLLKDFFTYAKTKYKLESDPTASTNRPEVLTADVRVLATEEMAIFISEVMRETQRVAMLVCLFTGVRVGELLALEVSDLSLNEQSIAVQRNLIRVKTESISQDNPHIKILNYKPEKKTHLIVQDTPKSKTSNRVIPLSDDLCELVLRHLVTMEKSEWPNPDNLLFPSAKGTYVDPKTFEKRLKAVSNRCEIQKVNPHALRHTFATRLVEEKVPLSVFKDLLGHSSIAITQRYTHRNSEIERDAVG